MHGHWRQCCATGAALPEEEHVQREGRQHAARLRGGDGALRCPARRWGWRRLGRADAGGSRRGTMAGAVRRPGGEVVAACGACRREEQGEGLGAPAGRRKGRRRRWTRAREERTAAGWRRVPGGGARGRGSGAGQRPRDGDLARRELGLPGSARWGRRGWSSCGSWRRSVPAAGLGAWDGLGLGFGCPTGPFWGLLWLSKHFFLLQKKKHHINFNEIQSVLQV